VTRERHLKGVQYQEKQALPLVKEIGGNTCLKRLHARGGCHERIFAVANVSRSLIGIQYGNWFTPPNATILYFPSDPCAQIKAD
jgi:hypothetical protein